MVSFSSNIGDEEGDGESEDETFFGLSIYYWGVFLIHHYGLVDGAELRLHHLQVYSAAIYLHSTIVAGSLYLLRGPVSQDWPEVTKGQFNPKEASDLRPEIRALITKLFKENSEARSKG